MRLSDNVSYLRCMRIAVNTRLLQKDKLDGIGVFTCETLKRITRAHPEHAFIFLFDRPFDTDFIFSKNVTGLVVEPQARHPFLFYLWFEWSLPKVLKKHKVDLLLSPDGYLSLSSGIPSLAVMHDLNFEHEKYGMPWLIQTYYRFFFPRFARKAKRIVTVSTFSKNDIATRYHVASDTIDVVYNAATADFKPLSHKDKLEIREKYLLGAPYFLFVGTLHERKNIVHLMRAFDLFKKERPSAIKLVLAGNKMWWTEAMEMAFQEMEHAADVVFTGRTKQKKLCELMGAATALTYVPFFEGFGIPLVEAMASGVPIIASNTTALPEVVGDAAILVDPNDVLAIKQAMLHIAAEENRQDYINAGLARSKAFSWDRSAELLWESMMQVMNPAG